MRSIIFIGSLLLCTTSFADTLHSNNNEVRANIPGQKNTAAFAIWHNASGQELTLTSLSSPAAKRVELHQHIHQNGQMQMREVKDFKLNVDQHVSMKEQNLHIMLMDMPETLKEGEKISITACFNGDLCTESSYTVISIHNEKKSTHQHHH